MAMRNLGKPNINKGLKTGFRPMSGLNTSGRRQAIPHTSGATGNDTGYRQKLRKAGVSSKRSRRMY